MTLTSNGSSGTGVQKQNDAPAAPPPRSESCPASPSPATASSGAVVRLVLVRLSGDSWLLPLGDSSEAELVSVGDAKRILSEESNNPLSDVFRSHEAEGEGTSGGRVAPFPASMIGLLHAETFEELDDAALLSEVGFNARLTFLGVKEWLRRCPYFVNTSQPEELAALDKLEGLQQLLPQIWTRLLGMGVNPQPFAQYPWDPAGADPLTASLSELYSAREELLEGALFLLDDVEYRTLVLTGCLPWHIMCEPACRGASCVSLPWRQIEVMTPESSLALAALRYGSTYRLCGADCLAAAKRAVSLLHDARHAIPTQIRASVFLTGSSLSEEERCQIRRGVEKSLMYVGDLVAAHPQAQLEPQRSDIESELQQLASNALENLPPYAQPQEVPAGFKFIDVDRMLNSLKKTR